MTPFDYISVVLAVVVGLGLSHLLLGIAHLLRRRRNVRFYWVHTTWIALTFVSIVYLWWSIWNLRTLKAWNFFSFLLLLLEPVFLFLAAAFVVPDAATFETSSTMDMETFYYANRRVLFGSFAGNLAVIIIQNTILNHGRIVTANLYIAVALAFLGGAAITARRSYHAVLAVTLIAWMLAFIFRFGLILQFQ